MVDKSFTSAGPQKRKNPLEIFKKQTKPDLATIKENLQAWTSDQSILPEFIVSALTTRENEQEQVNVADHVISQPKVRELFKGIKSNVGPLVNLLLQLIQRSKDLAA